MTDHDPTAWPEAKLQAEWLKLRGHLFDPLTRLPSLPLVFDRVRSRLETGEPMGLVLLDFSAGGINEVSIGWQAHDQLIQAAAAALCRARDEMLDPTDVVSQEAVRSDTFLCFCKLGSRTVEELHEALVDRVEQAARRLYDGPSPVIDTAAVMVEVEPRRRLERSLYQALAAARAKVREHSARRQSGRRAELQRMLVSGDLVVRYQPIVDLSRRAIHGFEALAAAPDTEIFDTPETLFTFAEQSDGIVDLERLCRHMALDQGQALLGGPRDALSPKLFLNCSAHAFRDPRLVGDLIAAGEALGLTPNCLVLEVTERVAVTEWREFRRILDKVREAGLLVAIDDLGAGYSSLRAVGEIEPDYMKFDFSLVQDLHRSPIKQDLFETLATLTRKIGARAIAEGIEVAEELEAVRKHGVDLGQGYLFARPALSSDAGSIHFPSP